jgi:hypothetical protein
MTSGRRSATLADAFLPVGRTPASHPMWPTPAENMRANMSGRAAADNNRQPDQHSPTL